MEFILTTTSDINGYVIKKYLAIVTGQCIIGTNFMRDIVAGLKDFWGGRIYGYEEEIMKMRNIAMTQIRDSALSIGANAIVNIKFDYEAIPVSNKGTSLLVTVSGTAVYVEPEKSSL